MMYTDWWLSLRPRGHRATDCTELGYGAHRMVRVIWNHNNYEAGKDRQIKKNLPYTDAHIYDLL